MWAWILGKSEIDGWKEEARSGQGDKQSNRDEGGEEGGTSKDGGERRRGEDGGRMEGSEMHRCCTTSGCGASSQETSPAGVSLGKLVCIVGFCGIPTLICVVGITPLSDSSISDKAPAFSDRHQ